MAFLDSIANVPRPQKVVAGMVGLLAVAGLGYFLLISPKIDERSTLRQQEEGLRKRLQAAKERLPSEKEMPRLYRQLTDIAFQSGLQVALFAPKPPADREDVAEVPIAMACEGGYHQLGAFFARMSRLPRIVDLGDFRLVSIERPTGTVRAELTLGTFIFRPEGAPAPAKPETAAPAPPAAAAPPTGQPPAKPGKALQ